MDSETAIFVINYNPTGDSSEAYFDWPNSQPVGEAPQCSICGHYIGGLPLLPPYRFKVQLFGNKFPDMFVEIGDQILLSERLVEAFKNAGLQGLDGLNEVQIDKVKSRKKNPPEPPKYFISNITRSETWLDRKASGLELEDGVDCNRCFGGGGIAKFDRLKFMSVGGENLFTTNELSGLLLADCKFKSFFEEARFTGIRFCNAADYHFDGVFYSCG